MKSSKIRKKLALARSHAKNPGYGQPLTPARLDQAPPSHQQRFYTLINHLERELDQRLAIEERRRARRESKG